MNWKKYLIIGPLIVIFLTLLTAYFWVSQIDKIWAPILETKILARQKTNSIRILANNLNGEKKWIGSLTNGRTEERTFIKLKDVPPQLTQAIVSIEDKRFFDHKGFDATGIFRAFIRNISKLKLSQGGSTITQQLVKNVFLTHDRTIKRKLIEIVLAYKLEKKFSKDEILEVYLNEVYLGQLGNVGIHGITRAANYYFNKEVSNLNLAESSLLAAIINSPGRYNPWRHTERAKTRREKVLNHMIESNFITKEEFAKAKNFPLPTKSTYIAKTRTHYLVNALKDELLKRHGEHTLIKGGFDIELALNLDFQILVEENLKNLKKKFGENIEGLVVAANPKNCTIKAYAGGSNFKATQFDRIKNGKRPIGSIMKPLIASIALRNKDFELSTFLSNQKLTWDFDKGRSSWTPKNFSNSFGEDETLRSTLEKSLNVPFVYFVKQIEPEGLLNEFFDPLRALGLNIPETRALPSAILGSIEQTPWNVLKSYLKLARQAQGISSDAADFKCELSFEKKPNPEDVNLDFPYNYQAARITIAALEGALRRGTSRSLGNQLPISQSWAGKTGTSNDSRDSWFVAISPDLVLLTWIGNDQNKKTKFTGSSGALRLAAPLIKYWSDNFSTEFSWPIQESLSWKIIDYNQRCILNEDKQYAISSILETTPQTTPPPIKISTNQHEYYYELVKQNTNFPTCTY